MQQINNEKFRQKLLTYYQFKPMRIFIQIINFICQITIALYIMILPIQLAYHELILNSQILQIQSNLDILVAVIFTIHILLYIDNSVQKIVKRPHSQPKYTIKMLGIWSRIITIEFIYDLLAWGFSLFMAAPQNNTLEQRQVQLLFIFKLYKLYKFHKKTIFILIGTIFYPIYKIIFTIIVVFIVISYLSSIFYALDVGIYNNGGPFQSLMWQYNVGTQPDLINQPFAVKILISNYWALGTASTAAYGDVSAVHPQQVIFTLFVLFLAGFLYGFYVNNIHSIPLQSRQQEMNIIQKFNQFQKHSKQTKQDRLNNNIDPISNQLYLKIICSIQYKQSQRNARQKVSKVVPLKYLQEIKFEIYQNFLYKSNYSLYLCKYFQHQNTGLKIANCVKQVFCQKKQDLYRLKEVSYTNLVFVHQGSINLYLPHELKSITQSIKKKGDIFGIYNFITNCKQPLRAIAEQYTSVFLIDRQQYKKCLTIEEAQQFNQKFSRCLNFCEDQIGNQPYKKFLNLLSQKQSILNLINQQQKMLKVQKLLSQGKNQKRINFSRQNLISKKLFLLQKSKKKSISIQTQQIKQDWQKQFQKLIIQ